jgi:hypothetical protein
VKQSKTPRNSLVPVASAGGIESSLQHATFGPPALIAGEDPAAYEELRARISAAVKPADFLEEIWVRDVVDLTWDSLRMRRLKVSFLMSGKVEGLEMLMRPVWGRRAEELSREAATGNRAAAKEADKHLASMGLDKDAPVAGVFATRIYQFERIDRMIMNAEGRRNAALREVDRHRSNLAQALRQASDDVIEAEFEDVPPQQPALEDAA